MLFSGFGSGLEKPLFRELDKLKNIPDYNMINNLPAIQLIYII